MKSCRALSASLVGKPLPLLAPPPRDGMAADVDDELSRAALPDMSSHSGLLRRREAETVDRRRSHRGSADFASVVPATTRVDASAANLLPTLGEKIGPGGRALGLG